VSYASVEQFHEWTEYLSAVIDLPEDGSNEAIQRLLDRASEDLDGYLRWPASDPGPGYLTHGRVKWQDPLAGLALARSCVEQAVYRCLQGEDDLAEGQSTITAAAGVSFSSAPLPLIGPQVLLRLAGVPSLHVYRHGLGVPDDDSPAAA